MSIEYSDIYYLAEDYTVCSVTECIFISFVMTLTQQEEQYK